MAMPMTRGRTRQRSRTMKRWSMALLLVVTALALSLPTAHAQEAANVPADSSIEQENAVQSTNVPDFVPTDEWQDILPGQAVPPGLHVRLNLATGKREAKLLSEEDKVLEAAPQPAIEDAASVTVTTDVTGEIKAATTSAATHALAVVEESGSSTAEASEPAASETEPMEGEVAEELDEAPPAREPNWNHEKIYEVLEALPEPPSVDGMDIHEARAKLSEPEFRRQMIKLWKKRQEELKEAVDSLQDDAKYLGKLLEDFREAETNGDTDGQLRVLEVLEWEVQDLDKTQVFNFIGGFGIITEYLNSTNLPVRASASWLVGTAVKNYKDGQDWAINAGAIPRLIDSLALPVPEDDPEAAAAIFEVKKKAVYALSSLARFNPRAQRLLLSLEGPEKLSQLMDARHPLGVQLKAVLFVHDLLFEEPAQETPTGGDEDALGQLHEKFQSSVWCSHTARFLQDNASKLQRNQQAETIQAMLAQLPSCKPEFVSADVKPIIESVVAAWQSDADVDSDEKQDLALVGSAILSAL